MEKIDVVKNYWASEAGKDLKKILSWFTEDAEFTSPTMELNGREEIKEFYQGMIDNFKEIDVTPTHTVEQGDEIAVEYNARLVRKSGEVRQAKGFNLFQIVNGKIKKAHCYFNPADF